MRWERFFDDLEDQIDSEWEAERAALESEGERVRLARLSLPERVAALVATTPEATVTVECLGGSRLRGCVRAVGVDWIGWDGREGMVGTVLIAHEAITVLRASEQILVDSAREQIAPARRSLNERMTLGFVLRDVARRRLPVTVALRDGRTLTGTIDRAMRDHLDMALHERDRPRRSGSVEAVVLIRLDAIAWVHLDDPLARL